MRATVCFTICLLSPLTFAAAQQDTSATKAPGKGAYSEEQATRGKDVYHDQCSACHLPKDHANADFRQKWNGVTVKALYDYIRSTMPDDAPSTLSEKQYLDATAYILKLNGMPAGEVALTADSTALSKYTIEIAKKP
jgi:S-disulfanyl-L-cysteine oxidoreductase SoxD